MVKRRHVVGRAALLLAALATTAGSIAWALAIPEAESDAPSPSSTDSASPAEFATSLSCAGAACHGSPSPAQPPLSAGVVHNEYTRWLFDDPHRDAFVALEGKLAERMCERLGWAPPTHEVRCLVCHANAGLADRHEAPEVQRGFRDFGTGCESCHGPAGRWLGPHTADSFGDLSDSEKEALGYRPLDNIATRGESCAACHVGAADQEVNHDMIAAGHPRLSFDLAAYQRRLPPHWNTAYDEHADLDLDARTWALGQLGAASAALEQLAWRASGDDSWPELAEFACFSCHHDLRKESWRQAFYPETRPAALGRLRFGGSAVYEVAHVLSRAEGQTDWLDAFDELSLLASDLSADPQAVADQARETQRLLESAADAIAARWQQADPGTLGDRLRGQLASQTEPNGLPWTGDWESLAQLALAADTLAPEEAASRDLLRSLAFPPDSNSPGDFDPRSVLGAIDRVLGR